jgi:hypothetical protein
MMGISDARPLIPCPLAICGSAKGEAKAKAVHIVIQRAWIQRILSNFGNNF